MVDMDTRKVLPISISLENQTTSNQGYYNYLVLNRNHVKVYGKDWTGHSNVAPKQNFLTGEHLPWAKNIYTWKNDGTYDNWNYVNRRF